MLPRLPTQQVRLVNSTVAPLCVSISTLGLFYIIYEACFVSYVPVFVSVAAPDTSTYQYDESSGYYYDPQTGLYYDPSSQVCTLVLYAQNTLPDTPYVCHVFYPKQLTQFFLCLALIVLL